MSTRDEAPEGAAAPPDNQALLEFEPVPRKTSQKNGWTPTTQRAFIARLAEHGSITKACAELGKDRSGVTKLYNSPDGASFRAAWHNAIEIAERRAEDALGDGPAPEAKPPTIDRRFRLPSSQPSPSGGEGAGGDAEPSEEQKLEFVEHLARKFMKKVAAERRARLDGEIVAADFYLRQRSQRMMWDMRRSQFASTKLARLRHFKSIQSTHALTYFAAMDLG